MTSVLRVFARLELAFLNSWDGMDKFTCGRKLPLRIPVRQRVENAESYYDVMNLEGQTRILPERRTSSRTSPAFLLFCVCFWAFFFQCKPYGCFQK